MAGLLLADTSAAGEPDVVGRRAMARRLLRGGMDPYAVQNLDRMVRPGASAGVVEHVLAMMRGTHPAGAAVAQQARADRPDLRAMLPDVAVPTAVVVGADDDFTPVAEAGGIAELIPGAELVVIDGAAHLPNLEQPAAFDAALDRLLTRVSCVENSAGTLFSTHDSHGVDRRRTSHPAVPASTASSSG